MPADIYRTFLVDQTLLLQPTMLWWSEASVVERLQRYMKSFQICWKHRMLLGWHGWHVSYTGITLLSLYGEVYARVLERKLCPMVEPVIQEEQCGILVWLWNSGPAPLHFAFVRGLWEYGNGVYTSFVKILWRHNTPAHTMPFAYDVKFLASSEEDLQHHLMWFEFKCEE